MSYGRPPGKSWNRNANRAAQVGFEKCAWMLLIPRKGPMSARCAQFAILTSAALLVGCGQHDRFAVVKKPETTLAEPPAERNEELLRERLEGAGVTIINATNRPMALVAGLTGLEAAWVEPGWKAAGISGGSLIHGHGCFAFYTRIEDYHRAKELVSRELERLARIQLTDIDSEPAKP